MSVENLKNNNETQQTKYKKNITAMFIGHIDAGKSTLIGQILIQLDMIPQGIIDSYKKLSKDNKKESWYLSYLMDTEDAERIRGKTFEMNRIAIELPYKNETRIVSLMDTPGHTGYITEMLHAAKAADIALLIISCRDGEFEAGLKGTTKEHLLLANNMNIDNILIVLNKIDTTSKERVDNIEIKVLKLASMLFKNVSVCRVSAQENINISLTNKIDGDLQNLRLRENTTNNSDNSLLDILSTFKIPEEPYFFASPLFTTKHFSEIYVSSGSHNISNKVIESGETKKIQLNEAKNDSEEPVSDLECGLFYRIKPHKGVLYNQELLDSGKTILEGSDLLIEFRLFSKDIFITKGYKCIIHIDSFEIETEVTDIVKETTVSDKKKREKVIFVTKDVLKNVTVLLRLKCKDPLLSFKGRKCALRDREFTVGVGVLRNLK